jgi:hypothetical protein
MPPTLESFVSRIDCCPQIKLSSFGSSADHLTVEWGFHDLLADSLIADSADEASVDQHFGMNHVFGVPFLARSG